MLQSEGPLRLIEEKGITKSHRIVRTRVCVAVSIIVGERFEQRLHR